MSKIKFYSINDMSYGYHLRECEKILKEYDSTEEIDDINYIIELYNVMKYIDSKIYPRDWLLEDIGRYGDIAKSWIAIIARFFRSITNNSFEDLFDAVDVDYKSDFWELIEKYNVYKSISEDKFRMFMDKSDVWLYELLKHKDIVKYFGKAIRDYMLDDYSSAEILLDKYELRHYIKKEPLNLPKELTSTDKEVIINNYIDSKEVNLNYLRLIANIQSNKDFLEVSPKTLLKAKKKIQELEKQLFPENSGILMETTVGFSKLQEEAVEIKMEGQSVTARYSSTWIENNTDYATLLNNFIYLFEFVDVQTRCLLVSKINEMGVLERLVFMSSIHAYKKGIAFDRMDVLSLLQMNAYYNELFSLGIRLEEVIEWFFEEYLSCEFGACSFGLTMPSVNSTLLEKCTNIMPAMESALKQFSLFVKEGEIDLELLEIRSEHLIYSNIPSLVHKKYVYGKGDEFKIATNLLFSDQSGLGYCEEKGKSYDNYFELLNNGKVKFSDYPEYHLSEINWLIDHKYLYIDEESFISFSDKLLIKILKDLYFNEVVVYWKYSNRARSVMDELENKGVVEFESTLFSRPEQDYINFYLNKSQFNNGLDLRNKYSHTQPKSDNDGRIHYQNYMVFLRLFVIAIIKINDDFCLLQQINDNRSSILC